MTTQTRAWDAAEALDAPERIALYLEAAFEDGDPALIVAAIGDAARAYGMTKLAKDAGLEEEALYRVLTSESNPEFATVLTTERRRLLLNFPGAPRRRHPLSLQCVWSDYSLRAQR